MISAYKRVAASVALLQLATADPLGALALAVPERAVIDAAAGEEVAMIWLAELHADVFAHAPERLHRRLA